MTTRRDLLAAAPAAALVAAVPAAAIAASLEPHPDAELIELGEELRAAWAVERSYYGAAPELDEASDAAYEQCQDIVQKIERMAAKTLDGVKVKAMAIHWCHSGEAFTETSFSPFSDATTDERLLSSLLNDILVMA